ncbi:MAG: hypothetical protein JO129_04350 [Candidatus Dependentiae bacterium]|nr:hypothetical protein [Candidatus Dependentiae bacterium]
MYIKQSKQLQFRSLDFYPLNSYQENQISFIYSFFHDVYGYIQRQGVIEYIKNLNSMNDGMLEYELVNLVIDYKNNLIYLCESYNDYHNKLTTPEIEILLDTENFLELCHIGFLKYVVMTKENFIHIILSWDKIWKQKSILYILLYQDDKDWYDVLPFQTQEKMEQFITDHTKK